MFDASAFFLSQYSEWKLTDNKYKYKKVSKHYLEFSKNVQECEDQ